MYVHLKQHMGQPRVERKKMSRTMQYGQKYRKGEKQIETWKTSIKEIIQMYHMSLK